jgi:hypothetical protein
MRTRLTRIAFGTLAAGALALGTVSAPLAQSRVLWDFHSCEAVAEGSSAGTVESVREVAVKNDLHAFDPGVLEHTVRPETAEELAVRLDSGPVVIFMHKVSPGLRAGQRVRVVLAGGTADVGPDLPQCASVFAALP